MTAPPVIYKAPLSLIAFRLAETAGESTARAVSRMKAAVPCVRTKGDNFVGERPAKFVQFSMPYGYLCWHCGEATVLDFKRSVLPYATRYGMAMLCRYSRPRRAALLVWKAFRRTTRWPSVTQYRAPAESAHRVSKSAMHRACAPRVFGETCCPSAAP